VAEGLRQLGIVGGGRVASALAASLADRLDVLVHARRPERLRLSPQAPAPTLVSDLADLAACPVLVVAVSDGAIPEVASALARALGGDARPGNAATTVLHTSGATTGARSLAPLLDVPGVEVGSMHPLLAVPEAATPCYFTHAPFVLEAGGARALADARALVGLLEGEPIELPDGSDGTKARYHALATMVATGTVTLVDRAAAALAGEEDEAGRAAFREAFGRLALTAAVNVSRGPGAEVLTGPLARGDDETLDLHDRVLDGHGVAALSDAIRRAARGMLDEGGA
jgi:predicted short-subunit dehydrogenase-like oxidoreductase (DUF2520 family)